MDYIHGFKKPVQKIRGMSWSSSDWVHGVTGSTRSTFLPLIQYLLKEACETYHHINNTEDPIQYSILNSFRQVFQPSFRPWDQAVKEAKKVILVQHYMHAGKIVIHENDIVVVYIDQTKNQGELYKHLMAYPQKSNELVQILKLLVYTEHPYGIVEEGETPLHEALTRYGNESQLAEVILTRKIPQQVRGPHGYYPLHLTCGGHQGRSYISNMDAERTLMLLKAGCIVNCLDDQKRTALHCAVTSSKSDKYCASQVVDVLIEHGICINKENKAGWKAMSYVCGMQWNGTPCSITHQDITILSTLVNNGANVNSQMVRGKTAMHIVVVSPTPLELKLVALNILCEKGADPNILDNEGFSPLHLAMGLHGSEVLVNQESKDTIQLLANSGGDFNISFGDGSCTPIHALTHSCTEAIRKARTNKDHTTALVLLQMILEKGADPNQKNEDSLTALQIFCNGITSSQITQDKSQKCIPLFLELLLKHGADPNVQDGEYITPLFHAVKWQAPKACAILLSYGANHWHYNLEGKQVHELVEPDSAEQKILRDFAEMKQCYCSVRWNKTTPPSLNRKILSKAFREVANYAGKGWKMVLRELLHSHEDYMDTEILFDKLQLTNNGDFQEQIYQGLLHWERSAGQEATVAALAIALRECNLVNLAEKVELLQHN